MTFDDRLQRAFDTLTGRLQDDNRREVQVAIDAVHQTTIRSSDFIVES